MRSALGAPSALHEALFVSGCDHAGSLLSVLAPTYYAAPALTHAPRRAAMEAAAPEPPLVSAPPRTGRCQVSGCTTPHDSMRAYHKRCRLCSTHMRADVLLIGASNKLRFCQKCAAAGRQCAAQRSAARGGARATPAHGAHGDPPGRARAAPGGARSALAAAFAARAAARPASQQRRSAARCAALLDNAPGSHRARLRPRSRLPAPRAAGATGCSRWRSLTARSARCVAHARRVHGGICPTMSPDARLPARSAPRG
jgi:hypothetical protein